MLSLNPRTDLAEVLFPDDFWIKDITDRYDQYLQLVPRPIDNIRDLIAESIKTWEIAGIEQNLISQNNFDGVGNTTVDLKHPTTENKTAAQQRAISVTFRMLDGMINWSCLYEHAWAKMNLPKAAVASDIPLQSRNTDGYVMFNMILSNTIFKSIDGFGVDYRQFDRSYTEFSCGWEFDGIKLEFVPPVPSAKGYNPNSGTTFDIKYENKEPVVPVPSRPSLIR